MTREPQHRAPEKASPLEEGRFISEGLKTLVRKTRFIWGPLLVVYLADNFEVGILTGVGLRPDYKRNQIEKEFSEINPDTEDTWGKLVYYLLIKPTRLGREVAYITYDVATRIKDKFD